MVSEDADTKPPRGYSTSLEAINFNPFYSSREHYQINNSTLIVGAQTGGGRS